MAYESEMDRSDELSVVILLKLLLKLALSADCAYLILLVVVCIYFLSLFKRENYLSKMP